MDIKTIILDLGEANCRDFVQLLKLNGRQWLRLLASETNLASFAGWCKQCGAGERAGEVCRWCGARLVQFDDKFWDRVGKKIRRALIKDRALIRKAKAEWENLYGDQRKPCFPGQLKWVVKVWEEAPKPPHRPFSPKLHYQVANWVSSLQRLGLSKEEIVDTMAGGDFLDDLVKSGRKDYANIPGEELRKLHDVFRKIVGGIPGNVLNLEEIWRTVKWVDRQRQDPVIRLSGERVRDRGSRRKARKPRPDHSE